MPFPFPFSHGCRCTCKTAAYFLFFLFLPSLLWAAPASTASALLVDIEFSGGISLLADEPNYSGDYRLGPQFNLGVRKSIVRGLCGRLAFDFGYNRLYHNYLAETENIDISGAHRTLFQVVFNLGTRFKRKPNVSVGIGRYYLWHPAITLFYGGSNYRGGYELRRDSGTIAQLGVHFDLVQTQSVDVFFMPRFVWEIGRSESDGMSYFPFTVGFRFH